MNNDDEEHELPNIVVISEETDQALSPITVEEEQTAAVLLSDMIPLVQSPWIQALDYLNDKHFKYVHGLSPNTYEVRSIILALEHGTTELADPVGYDCDMNGHEFHLMIRGVYLFVTLQLAKIGKQIMFTEAHVANTYQWKSHTHMFFRSIACRVDWLVTAKQHNEPMFEQATSLTTYGKDWTMFLNTFDAAKSLEEKTLDGSSMLSQFSF
jgi:hypothetical protein